MSKKTKSTVKKPSEPKPWHFKPGNKMGGRPKGSRNKFAEKFLKDFLEDWEKHGTKALRRVRTNDPSAYLRVAAAILPKELNIKEGEGVLEALLEKFNDKELDDFIAGLIAVGASQEKPGRSTKATAGTKSSSIH